MNPAAWDALTKRAGNVITRTLADLPPAILAEARQVPCLFERENADDPDLLGIYCDFSPGQVSDANGPIILYLATIADFCLDEGADFETEVRLTYLHELGHHLGWDEGDLESRGLA